MSEIMSWGMEWMSEWSSVEIREASEKAVE